MNENLETRLLELEQEMQNPNLWSDKTRAQAIVAEYQQIKDRLENGNSGSGFSSCILSVLAGAGGDDAEDFVRMLVSMYTTYCEKNGWSMYDVDATPSEHGGYRSYSVTVAGATCFEKLKLEMGVHRLIRISPFNSLGKRQTSFALVEVIPEISRDEEVELAKTDLQIEFSKAGGPGGQNVNKRETAVRIVHIPTGISVYANGQRSQESNREAAMKKLRGKLFLLAEEKQNKEGDGYKISGIIDNEWGSQMRTYTLHPYQLVKDHRTNIEIRNVDSILKDANLEELTKNL
jgi:peptide chain release factor 2